MPTSDYERAPAAHATVSIPTALCNELQGFLWGLRDEGMDAKDGEIAVELAEALAKAPASAGATPTHPEDRCEKCGRANIVWFAPSELWNKAVRENGLPEILCPVCFVEAAEVAGIRPTAWKVAPEAEPASASAREAEPLHAQVTRAFLNANLPPPEWRLRDKLVAIAIRHAAAEAAERGGGDA